MSDVYKIIDLQFVERIWPNSTISYLRDVRNMCTYSIYKIWSTLQLYYLISSLLQIP